MSSAGSRGIGSGGFSLLEMLVVMTIVVLSAAAVAAALPRIVPGSSVDLAASRLAGGLKQARMRAISSERVIPVSIDPDGRRFRVGAGRPVGLPGGVRIPAPRPVRFYPDGGADPVSIRLVEGRRTLRIDVDALTGRVMVR